MTIIYVLVGISLILATVAVVAFTIAVKRSQFEDLETPAYRVLIDDETHPAAGGER